ncbi:MAG: site-specific integrase [Candidatus Thiodiazotropha endolucinida]|nr:site-specific integrase [Candidatus Thiodiazotropha taylori]MCW4348648.1 site-specific integrase [Candidatus Thiodiazotropha endolucinida]
MARRKMTKAEAAMSTKERKLFGDQKGEAASSKFHKFIEVRGVNQFRVRFRGKEYGGTKYIDTYETLEEAESAAAKFLEKVHRAGVGMDGVEKEFKEAERADKTTFADLLRARQVEVLNDTNMGKNHAAFGMLRVMLRNDDLCGTPLSSLAPLHFEQYIEDRLEEGVVSGTVRREIGMMSGIITKAIERGGFANTFSDGNPASQKKIDYPADSEARTRRVSQSEEKKIREAIKNIGNAKGAYFGVMFEIAITLGMRQAEIRQIEWHDINFEKGYIYIPKTKTNRPRSVPLLANIAKLLKEWLARNERLAHRYGVDLPSWVFWHKDNGVIHAMTGGAIQQMWNKVRKRAGIELPDVDVTAKVKDPETGRTRTETRKKANPDNLHFHDFRHEATSRLFEIHGLSIIEVMSITGHRTATMMERYTHLHAQDIRKKIEEVGGKLEDMPITKEMAEFLAAEGKRLKIPAEGVVSLLIMQAMHDRQNQLALDAA